MRKKIQNIALAVIVALSLTACDSDDDLQEIFTDHSWTLSFIKEGSGQPIESKGKDYVIVFKNNTFLLSTPGNATISGNWRADGGNRAFSCSNIRTSGNIENDNIANKMKNILQNSTSYAGDTNWLQIIVQKDNIYMQFYNK